MLTAATTGLAAGIAHAVTGPDHLAAVGPIALDRRRRTWRTGFVWGLGHAVGVAVLGALSWFLRDALPLDRFSAWSERAVGVVLIGVGLWALRTALRRRIHSHEHVHDGTRHSHVHVHGPGVDHDAAGAHEHAHAAAGIGLLHGFAGTAHLVGVLPAIALGSRTEMAGYLSGYGVGSILAMTGFAAILGALATRAAAGPRHTLRTLELVAGGIAILVGGYWLAGI